MDAAAASTAPNGAAQEAVLRQALANAGVSGPEIGYVEAHGTGTSLGDPIEAHALAAVLGKGREAGDPLVVGSVKTNIGHLESAAGVAGLIKVVLSLQHEEIPKQLHFQKLNPHIDWSGAAIEVATEAREWKRGAKRRLAGVSSFGFSGTNAHVIVEEAPVAGERKRERERPLHVLALSARSEAALAQLGAKYADALSGEAGAELGDICYTANAGRAHFSERAIYIAGNREGMRDALLAGAAVRGKSEGSPEIAFLFPGQGAQYAGMGKELYETQPVFRRALEECAELLKESLDEPLLEVLWGASTQLLDETAYTQPALFAVEYALAVLWRSWGIEPSVVLGHSVGEYVAACVAGVYGLKEGLKLIATRARLMQAVSGCGAMAAVFAGEAPVREALRGLEERVSLAAVNGPESVVISGYEPELKTAEERLRQAGLRVERLKVSHGFHSPQMEEMEAEFGRVAGEIEYQAPKITLISSVTGQVVGKRELSEGSYWKRQVRQPVEFRAAMETLGGQGYRVFVEVGPGTTLVGLGRQCLKDEQAVWAPVMRKARGEWTQALESVGKLYLRGAEVNWAGFEAPYQRRRVALPTYPFERQRYWVEDLPRRKTQLPGDAEVRQSQKNPEELSGIPSPAEVPAHWSYTVEWQSKPLGKPSSDTTPPPADLAQSLRTSASTLRSQHGLVRYDALRPGLDRLSTAYIVRALAAAGWKFAPGNHYLSGEMETRLSVIPVHRKLFGRLLAILAEEGILRQDDGKWVVVANARVDDIEALSDALRIDYPEFTAEIEMTCRCGASLCDVLQGRADPIQLLFPNGSFETAERLYTDSPGARVFNRLAHSLVTAEIASHPAGKIRVLEIGAGTGGTTAFLADAFPAERTEYCYTDVSSLFLNRAAEKFKKYPFFQYEALDIEHLPEAQGFAHRKFDIVIAANVLHATVDLRKTLRHVRSLLSASGLLVLLEGTYPERWVDLTFGLTQGWWRFEDYDLRPSYPLLSSELWRKVLIETGFEATEAVHPKEGSHQALLYGRASGEAAASSQRWLIIAETQKLVDALSEHLQNGGHQATLAFPSEASRYLRSAQYDQVVFVPAPDCRPVDSLSSEDLFAAQFQLSANLLDAMQGVIGEQVKARLWIVTKGAQPVCETKAALDILQNSIWGLGKTFALENPERWGGMLDLDPFAEESASAAGLLDEIFNNEGEDQVAFRNGERSVARLVRRPPPSGEEPVFKATSVYLVTGGLGGLGLKVAHWMVERGARRLVLLGRSGLPERSTWSQVPAESPAGKRITAVQVMERKGVHVDVAAIDICDEKKLSDLLERFGPDEVRGIVHAAAAVDSSSLKHLSMEKLRAVLAPKVEGTWVLHRLTRSRSLDFFVMFSSWASAIGAENLGHYVCANQFLDAFAHYRRDLHLPALAINWAAWDEIRAASDDVLRDYARGGLRFMQSQLALGALGRALTDGSPQIAIADVDWRILKPLYETRRRRPLLEQVESTEEQTVPQKESPLIELLREASPVQCVDLLIDEIRREVAAVLRLDSSEVGANSSLFDLGLDSLMAVELKGRFEKLFGVAVPSTLLFQYPNVRLISQYFADELAPATSFAIELPASTGVEDASEDELTAMLTAAIQDLK